MSTTYFIVVNEKDVEIARTDFNGEQVEVTWVNPLANLLVDEEVLMSDSGNQLCETVGDLRELEVPKMWDDMTKYELIEEIKRVRDERDEIITDLMTELSETQSEVNHLTMAVDRSEYEIKDVEEVCRITREKLVKANEDAFQNRCSADHLENEISELEKDLEEMINDKVTLKDEVHGLIVEISELEKDLEEMANEEVHGLIVEISELEKDLEEMANERVTLKDEVHDLIVDKDEVANANMHFEDGLEAKLKSAIHEIKDAEEQIEILKAEVEMVKDQRSNEVNVAALLKSLENELEEVTVDLEQEMDKVDELKRDRDFFRSKSNALENERWGETQLLTREKEVTMDLDEARKALSNALQESLDREAKFRQEIRVMKQREADDTLFEDYSEIRRIVQGEGDLCSITHGEFLEVLQDIVSLSKSTVGFKSHDEELEILKRREKHFSECLKEEQTLNRGLNRANRELERKLLTINDKVIETENFTVTIFGETRSDGRGGFFEHYIRGEDFGGGLWFDGDELGNDILTDYDGVSVLPKEVAKAVEAQGFSVDGVLSDDDSKSFD